MADVRRIKDTSRQGRYHNARYKVLGEEEGLTIAQHPQIGWSLTELAAGTAEEYVDELEDLAAALVAYRYAEGQVPALPDDPGADGAADGRGPRTAWCWSVPSPANSAPRPRSSSSVRSCAEPAGLSSASLNEKACYSTLTGTGSRRR